MHDFLVIANWKLGGNLDLLSRYKQFFQKVTLSGDLVFLLPTPYLGFWQEGISGASLGAQHLDAYTSGGYTGCVSAEMLQAVGCQYVCLGHSERRCHFQEGDDLIARKYVLAKSYGLVPVLCIGESREARDTRLTESVLRQQIEAVVSRDGFQSLPKHTMVVAYEPVWAIGAKEAASIADVEKVSAFVQSLLAEYGQSARFCYGGSVDADNCLALRRSAFVSGVLVGRASTDYVHFKSIVDRCLVVSN